MEFDVEVVRGRVLPSTDTERAAAQERIAALARPRLTGSAGAEEVAAELKTRFGALGYEVKELPFQFSAAPGRLALSAAGAVHALTTAIVLAALLGRSGLGAVAALVVGGALIAGIARYTRRAVTGLAWMRTTASNWLVHRPGVRPRYLVVAHRDSKSQLLPTCLRAVAIAAGAAAWLVLLVVALFEIANPELLPRALVWLAGVVGLLAGLGLAACWVGNHSPGALDNATGLAALLGLAEREKESEDIALLVTEAEELVLAGAYAVASSLPPVEGVINLDSLDDDGDLQVIERFGRPRRGYAPHLAAAILTAADALRLPARRRDLPLGVMVDHMAFTDAGLPALTLHRGTNASFHRVHRPSDDATRLDGTGVSETVAVLSGALAILRSGSPS